MSTESVSSSSSGIPEEISQAYISSSFEELPSKGYSQLFKVKRGGRYIICKCLKPEYRGQGFYEALLKKEYEIGVSLDHSNIVKVYDFYTDDTYGSTITMEWVDGCDLSVWLKEKHSNAEKLKIAKEILDALKYCHSKQIIHRDIKPSNILITRNGLFVKLIDFGLSDTDDYAILKQPAGTRSYAAPEQLILGNKIDQRTDIFSFGKILKLLFPHRYFSVVKKCLRRDVERRYANVDDVRRTIERIDRLPYIMSAVFILLCVVGVVLYMEFQPKPNMSQVAEIVKIVDTLYIKNKPDTVVVREIAKATVDSVQLKKDKALKDLLAYNDAIFDKAYAEAVKDEYESTANLRFDVAWAQVLSHTAKIMKQWSDDKDFVFALRSAAYERYDTYATMFFFENPPNWNKNDATEDSIVDVESSLSKELQSLKQ